jgi:hypothetical protein
MTATTNKDNSLRERVSTVTHRLSSYALLLIRATINSAMNEVGIVAVEPVNRKMPST